MNLMFQLFFKEVKEFLKVKMYLKVIVPRSEYAYPSVGVHMSLGRGTHVLRSGYDDFMCSLQGRRIKLFTF